MATIKLNPTHYEKIITGEDPIYRLSKNIRESIIHSFKEHNFIMEGSYTKSLGCSFRFFKSYLEDQMEDWQNFDNFCFDCLTTQLNISWTIKYKTFYEINTIKDLNKQNHYTNIIIQCHSEINMYN